MTRFAQLRFQGSMYLVPCLIIGAFVMVGIGYSLVVPPFETPDEIYHYAFARHLALGNALPVQSQEADGPWRHEGMQAPLYYLLLGRLIANIDHEDFEQVTQTNPRANLGNPHYPGNKNLMLYSTQARPMRGTALAVHVGRWFSLSLSTMTLWFTYQLGRQVFASTPGLALVVLATAAALPQFAFVSASVSNDALVVLMATLTLYKLAALLARAPQDPLGLGDWLQLGLLLGLAALSKLQALGLLPVAAMAMLLLAWQRRRWSLLLSGGAAVSIVVLMVAGWWYWRNWLLYGDLLAIRQLLEIEGLRDTPTTLGSFWGELRGLRYSFWGLFGWFSVLLPAWIYTLLDIVTLVAVVGLGLALHRIWRTGSWRLWLAQPRRRAGLVLATWGLLLLGLMLYWLTFAISSQGRLLFPALSAYACALVYGLHRAVSTLRTVLIPRATIVPATGLPRMGTTLPTAVLGLLPAGLLACSVYALSVLLPGSYHAAPPVSAVPEHAVPVGRVYGGVLELVALTVPEGPYTAGAKVPVTLYLRTLVDADQNYQLFVQLLDEQIREIGNVTSHPGWGKHPTSLWKTGEIYEDRYEITLDPESVLGKPQRARLYVGFMTCGEELLPVPGFEWDIASRTVAHVWVQQ